MHIILVALVATFVIFVYDRKTRGNLNMSPAQRAEYNNAM